MTVKVKVDYASKLRFIIVKFNWLKNLTDIHTYTYLLVFGVFENKEFINTYYLIITFKSDGCCYAEEAFS